MLCHRGAPCTGWVEGYESVYHASGGACLQATPGAARGASGNPVGLGGVLLRVGRHAGTMRVGVCRPVGPMAGRIIPLLHLRELAATCYEAGGRVRPGRGLVLLWAWPAAGRSVCPHAWGVGGGTTHGEGFGPAVRGVPSSRAAFPWPGAKGPQRRGRGVPAGWAVAVGGVGLLRRVLVECLAFVSRCAIRLWVPGVLLS